MRGLGKHSKRGSGWIVGGVCGGAVVPPILGATADAHSTALAMVVPMCFFIAAWTYSLAVNFVPAYRIPADKFSTTEIGITNVGTKDEESGSPVNENASDHEKVGVGHSDDEHSPEIQKV